jgi:hypothetical protein
VVREIQTMSKLGRVVLILRRSLPVFPDQPTISEAVGSSQKCWFEMKEAAN